MKHKSQHRPALFVLNEPTAPRLNPELAKEIGLNESLLFLQLEFWLRLSGSKQEDGQYWIYESVTDIQEVFSFWSRATVNRIIHSLIEKQLVQVGNWNKHKYDKTRWFTLNLDGITQLKSVRIADWWVSQNETPTDDLSQNETSTAQNETRSNQNETTIPDLSSDLSSNLSEDAVDGDSPSPDDTLFWGEDGPPKKRRPLSVDLPRDAKDDLDLGRHSAEKRAELENPDWTDASRDTDSWDTVHQIFASTFLLCTDTTKMDQGKRDNQTRKIQELAQAVGAGAERSIEAIKSLRQLEGWMVGPSATPFRDCWADGFQNLLIADRDMVQAQINAKGVSQGRDAPPATKPALRDAINAAIKERAAYNARP